MNVLTAKVVAVAQKYEAAGIHEKGGNNRGPEVERLLARVGMSPGNAWCAATAWSIVDDACMELGIDNPLPRSASVHRLWEKAPYECKGQEPMPGTIFCHDAGGGLGHCGVVVGVDAAGIITIEGNTNKGGSREGDGVYRKRRPFDYVSIGYLDPSAALK